MFRWILSQLLKQLLQQAQQRLDRLGSPPRNRRKSVVADNEAMAELPRVVEIALDPAGRATDKATGKYLRSFPGVPCAPGLTRVGLGGLEGGFLTVDEEGDLAEWEPPADWLVH